VQSIRFVALSILLIVVTGSKKPSITPKESTTQPQVPTWIKNTAKWWSSSIP